jgi:hypothetical protein
VLLQQFQAIIRLRSGVHVRHRRYRALLSQLRRAHATTGTRRCPARSCAFGTRTWSTIWKATCAAFSILRPRLRAGCLEFHKTERSVRTASSEQVRRPIFKEGRPMAQFEPWLGHRAEITVTAQRRTENIQDVPISIQAIDRRKRCTQLNVQTLDDYIKYLPNVTTAKQRTGAERGFHARLERRVAGRAKAAVRRDLWPNVAIYLDNQSGQLPNRNLDIYAADSESHRGSGRSAGNAVRRRRRGGRHPLHHQRAEARRTTEGERPRPATESPLTEIRIPT